MKKILGALVLSGALIAATPEAFGGSVADKNVAFADNLLKAGEECVVCHSAANLI